MRIWIEKGYLLQPSATDDEGQLPVLEFQVFNEDGSPATGSYRGEAFFDGRRIVIGDPQRGATLTEYIVERQATSESWNYYRGFKQALEDRRQMVEGKFPKKLKPEHAKYATATTRWWEGYNAGWFEKRKAAKEAKSKKTYTLTDDDGRVVAHARTKAAAHRATRRAKHAGSRVARQ
jgi:hypothetical protein